MSYHDWECPECGETTTQPDWILEVFCMRNTKHKRGRRRKMIRVNK